MAQAAKTVVLGITGGIAAYKACEVVSRLKKAGVNVHVIMSRNACEFVQPLTLQTLSQNLVAVDTFEAPDVMDVEHISLAKKADVLLIAPATANIIAKLALGIADDMLTTTALATPGTARRAARSSRVRASALSRGSWLPIRICTSSSSAMPLGVRTSCRRCMIRNIALHRIAQLSAISSTTSADATLCRDSADRMGRISMDGLGPERVTAT